MQLLQPNVATTAAAPAAILLLQQAMRVVTSNLIFKTLYNVVRAH
jgi:hypothetical protein